MAAAVQVAPQMAAGVMGGHHPHGGLQYDAYRDGYAPHEDLSEHHPSDVVDEDMEAYYQQHEYEQHFHQQHMLAQQAGMQYHHDDVDGDMDDDDQEMYSDDSSDESVLPDENIDFGLIYALHTFLATVEGQASVVKGDSLLLLDDANSYWWLVRVLKTEDVGYIPAENVETPYERLARLNKHRNIDVAAATHEEKVIAEAKLEQRRETHNKFRHKLGWGRLGGQQSLDPYDDDPEQREGRRVAFDAPTYVDHPGVTWSSDEDDDDDDVHDGDIEDDDHDVNMDHHIQEQQLGYETEPDDGIEWAEDAVEALRNAGSGVGIDMTDDDMAPEHRHRGEPTEHAVQSGAAPEALAVAGAAAAGVAGAAGAGVAAGMAHEQQQQQQQQQQQHFQQQSQSDTLSAPGQSPEIQATTAIPGAFPPAPEGSPSPSGSPAHGLAARVVPTPPPHRAPAVSPSYEASPEPPMREMTPATPPPQNAVADAGTPASDMHPSPLKGHQPSASIASVTSLGSTRSVPPPQQDFSAAPPTGPATHASPQPAPQGLARTSMQSLNSVASNGSGPSPSAMATAGAAGVAGAAFGGAAAHHGTPMSPAMPTSPPGNTPASPASAGPPVMYASPRVPVGTASPAASASRSPAPPTTSAMHAPAGHAPAQGAVAGTTPSVVPPLWYSDAFDVARLAALINARATDIKRNTPVPRPRKPSEPTDEVQRVFYGDRPEIDHMPQEIRAPFVHLQAKMDAFDREIDDLLGSLVAAH